MDDYTWQQKLLERRTKRHREGFFIFLIFAAVIGTCIWYWLIYTRTPSYALEQVRTAIEKRDVETFQRYVNLDLLTAKAYDDLTVDLFAYDSTLTPQTKVLFEKFYVLIKPQITEGMRNTMLQRVQTGEWGLPTGLDILKGRQLGIDFERFLERSQLRNTTLKETGTAERQGTTATASLEILDDYSQTPFTLQLVLEENVDGDWQIAYIQNYKDYLNAVAPLHNQDITNYIQATQDIVDHFNDIFRDQQVQFRSLTKTTDGKLSSYQNETLQELIQNDIIPALKKRQQKLDDIAAPPGAAYLAQLRKESTEITIQAWQHFIKGLKEDSTAEFDTAAALHKQELELDLRIEDIVKHTAVSKNMPNIP